MLSENGACGGKEQRDDAAARHRGRSQPMRGKKIRVDTKKSG